MLGGCAGAVRLVHAETRARSPAISSPRARRAERHQSGTVLTPADRCAITAYGCGLHELCSPCMCGVSDAVGRWCNAVEYSSAQRSRRADAQRAPPRSPGVAAMHTRLLGLAALATLGLAACGGASAATSSSRAATTTTTSQASPSPVPATAPPPAVPTAVPATAAPTAPPAPPTPVPTVLPAPPPPAPKATPCVIPQGGGGDGDADNFGAPSDGDGCDR